MPGGEPRSSSDKDLMSALDQGETRRIDETKWSVSEFDDLSTNTLNRLLVTTGHHQHQIVAREL